MLAVEAKALSFCYKGQLSPVFENLNFELKQGAIAAVTGPSGCGKTTLGYCICGVIPRLIKGNFSGQVHLRGRASIVFQDPDTQIFLPTVEDELAFGPENLCLARQEIGKRIELTLELLGLGDLRRENPALLSGGQKQLVALGGVLTLSADVIVLDETLSQLDTSARARVKSILLALKQENKTVIIIDHDANNLELADEVWYLDHGILQRCLPGRHNFGKRGSCSSQ